MIKLNTGFSRKVGEPNYGSRGASVNLELEVESAAIQDPDKMHRKIRALFALARKAVDEELRNGSPRPGKDDAPAKAEARNADGPVCSECGQEIQSEKVVKYSTERYGKPVCYRCQKTLNGNGGK